MLFKKRIGILKREYDEKLLTQMEDLKNKWEKEKKIIDHCLDLNEDIRKRVQLAEKKYFYLFKEAKVRKLNGMTRR